MNSVVQIENLSRSYGSVKAVAGLSFSIGEGELFGLIGPDGAGKTTLLRVVCGLVRCDSGSISVFGIDPGLHPRRVREFIGYMPQRFSLYPDLTVAENLRFFADLYLVPNAERRIREERLMEFSRLGPFRNRRAAALSGGMKQKLALSCTLIHKPRLLILDEPTTGVDPVSRREFWTILKELSEEGIALLVSTPYMDEALQCHRTALMHQGKIVAIGTPSEVTDLYPYVIVEAASDDPQQIRRNLIARGIAPSCIHRFGSVLHVACTDQAQSEIVITQVIDSGGKAVQGQPTIEDTFVALSSISDSTRGEASS